MLHLPQDFSADILAGRTAPVQLLVDARRSNTALMVQSYAASIVDTYAQDLHPGRKPLVLLTRDWFNPTLESSWFILPGLVCVLSMIMVLLISALSLARERELGTFEQLLVTPLRPFEILIGKALPGIIVGLIDANIVLAAALLWFRLPFRATCCCWKPCWCCMRSAASASASPCPAWRTPSNRRCSACSWWPRR